MMLKIKVLVSWLLMVAMAMAAMYVLLTNTTVGVERKVVQDEIDKTSALVRQQFDLQGRALLDRLQRFALESPIVTMMSEQDSSIQDGLDRLHNLVIPLLQTENAKINADLFWLVDGKGRVVLRLENPTLYGDDIHGIPWVKNLLAGVSEEGAAYFDNKLLHLAAVPIVDLKHGRIAGGVLVGQSMDQAWLDALGLPFNTNLAVLFRGSSKLISGQRDVQKDLNKVLPELKLTQTGWQGEFDKFEFSREDVSYLGRAFLFGESLASFRAGLAVFEKLPPRWLPPADPRIQMLALIGVVALVIGILVTFLISAGIRRDSTNVAKTILELKKTGTVISGLNETKYIAEMRPFVAIMKEFLSLPENNKTAVSPAQKVEAQPETPAVDTKAEPEKPEPLAIPAIRSAAEEEGLEQGDADHVMDSITGMLGVEKPEKAPAQNDALPTLSDKIDLTPDSTEKKPVQKPKPAAATKPPSAAPQRPIPDDPEEYYLQVYQEYLNMRDMLKQPTHNINRDKFIANLRNSTERICEKQGCEKVRFSVFAKNGQASVKAAPEK